jgi:acyl-CoA hydrolase
VPTDAAKLPDRPERPASESRVEMVEIMFPNDANPAGTVMGGRVMHLIDVAAAVAAGRHARTLCVTASADHIDFRSPVRVGDLLILKSSVNYVGTTSLEVGVRVEVEDRKTGQRRHTSSAYLTFVALDDARRPVVVPRLGLETDDDRRRHTEAERRRHARLIAIGKEPHPGPAKAP